jgi:hypothetical protein
VAVALAAAVGQSEPAPIKWYRLEVESCTRAGEHVPGRCGASRAMLSLRLLPRPHVEVPQDGLHAQWLRHDRLWLA